MVAENRPNEDHLPAGTVIGDYVIDAVLGSGGFAITYLAHHARLTRQTVAIKEFFPDHLARRSADGISVRTTGAEFREGCREFLDEGQRLAALRDQGVVRVVNFFEANNTAYLVMDHEQGQTLEQFLSARGPLPEAEVLRFAADMLAALDSVHGAGILHRDINPSNVIIRPDGRPVLIDFGAARCNFAQRTRTVAAVVTDGYSPVEQYTSDLKLQGPWTDLYALGATLYHMITGRRPATATARAMADSEGEADPMSGLPLKDNGPCGPVLGGLVDALLQVKRSSRPQDVAAARTLMGRLSEGTGPVPRTRVVGNEGRFGPKLPNNDGGRALTDNQRTQELAPMGGSSWLRNRLPPAFVALLFVGGFGYGLLQWRQGQIAEKQELEAQAARMASARVLESEQVAETRRPNLFANANVEDLGNGRLRDTKTGMVWTQADNGEGINWHDANDYCREKGMRLPSAEELTTMFDRSDAATTPWEGLNKSPDPWSDAS